MKPRRLIPTAAALAAILALAACHRERGPRHYSEILDARTPVEMAEIRLPETGAPAPSAAPSAGALAWTLPQGWRALPASGMRLATFRGPGVECGLVALGGQAGGVTANAARWAGQLGLSIPDHDLADFLAGQEGWRSGGLQVLLIDFDEWVKAAGGQSMVVAMASSGDATYFLKAQGPKRDLAAAKPAFRSLARSLRVTP